MIPADNILFQRLIDKIYQERGIDFRGYSRSSLARRFARRMQTCGVGGYDDYLKLLDADSGEYEHLINAIFVTVTRFFRNKAAFEALTQALQSALGHAGRDTLRIWSAGCATGQEPYTIAMLATRLVSESRVGQIRIIATDIDDLALAKAAQAQFERSEIRDIPGQWQEMYFIQHPKGYALTDQVRSLVTFHHHNLVSEAPFEKMDVIVCRNVLIYFNLALQMRVIDKLHQSLRKGGHLLLGRYEMLIKQARRQFTCVDFDVRLYRKK